MAKETVFNPGYPHRDRPLVGCIIIHPELGTGLITAHDAASTLGDSRWYVLWADRGSREEVGETILRSSHIIRPDDGADERIDWVTATSR